MAVGNSSIRALAQVWMPRGDYLITKTLYLGGGGEIYGDGDTLDAGGVVILDQAVDCNP